ncbi:MAG: TSUP family transporter, partial [Ginsengibacter sp.]
MSVYVILILLIIGLAAGILGGLVGVGGGIIIVPALIYFLSFSQKEAQGTSLGILLLPIGILGVWQYYKAG